MPKFNLKHKYGAKPRITDGIRFDSQIESRYYEKLKLRQASGEVIFFLRQVPLHLPGKVKLVVDFVEFLSDQNVRFIDVKGFETKDFIMKKKMAEALYPIEIEIVKKV